MRSRRRIREERLSIIAAALNRSKVEIDLIAGTRPIHACNADRLSSVCHDCLSGNPVREPVAATVSEVGRLKFGKFPAPQSLLNRYSHILQIWRKAYREIVNLEAPKRAGNESAVDPSILRTMDSGARAHFRMVAEAAKSLKADNDRLREIIEKARPFRGSELEQRRKEYSDETVANARKWLSSLRQSGAPLELRDVGVKTTRAAYIGRTVIPLDVIRLFAFLIENAI